MSHAELMAEAQRLREESRELRTLSQLRRAQLAQERLAAKDAASKPEAPLG